MKKLFITILVALQFAITAHAADDVAKNRYETAKKMATANYDQARAQCDALSGNPKNVCIAEAKAEQKRTKANAEAEYENTPKAKMRARLTAAEADFSVAKEKCKAQTGNAKDVCIKEAKAAYMKAKVDAKSHQEIIEIKSEATQDKLDAEYKVEIAKCSSLAGPPKEACIASARTKYGK